MIPTGIEPAAFRFVAQYLNQPQLLHNNPHSYEKLVSDISVELRTFLLYLCERSNRTSINVEQRNVLNVSLLSHFAVSALKRNYDCPSALFICFNFSNMLVFLLCYRRIIFRSEVSLTIN